MLPILELAPDNLRMVPHKPTVFGLIDPCKFLELTTGRTRTVAAIFAETRIPLERYDPDANGIPWLRVLVDTGRILGHNGRHRAAMVIKAGHRLFPTVLVLQRLDPRSGRVRTLRKPARALPEKLIGQFRPGRVRKTSEIFTPLIWFGPQVP